MRRSFSTTSFRCSICCVRAVSSAWCSSRSRASSVNCCCFSWCCERTSAFSASMSSASRSGSGARIVPGSMPRFCNCTSIKSDSHRHRRLPGTIRSSPVDAFEQHRQLSAAQRHGSAVSLRPDEAAPLQTLLKQTQSVAIEPKKFNHVTAPASKNKDVTGVGFLCEDRLHLGTEPVEAAPHVCNTGGEPDPRACPQVDHRVRLSSTARIKAGSAEPSMLSSARPGNSIVTLPVDGSAGVVVGVSTNFGAASSAAIVTGTRAAPGFDLRTCNSPRSYCRFQRNTWLAFTPFASAIPATLAPGSSVCFTILSFSSTLRKIRRLCPGNPVPSMRLIVGRPSSTVQMGRPDAYPESDEAVTEKPRVDRLAEIHTRIDDLRDEFHTFSKPAPWPKRFWNWIVSHKGLSIFLCLASIFGGSYFKYWLDHRSDSFNAAVDTRIKTVLDAPGGVSAKLTDGEKK